MKRVFLDSLFSLSDPFLYGSPFLSAYCPALTLPSLFFFLFLVGMCNMSGSIRTRFWRLRRLFSCGKPFFCRRFRLPWDTFCYRTIEERTITCSETFVSSASSCGSLSSGMRRIGQKGEENIVKKEPSWKFPLLSFPVSPILSPLSFSSFSFFGCFFFFSSSLQRLDSCAAGVVVASSLEGARAVASSLAGSRRGGGGGGWCARTPIFYGRWNSRDFLKGRGKRAGAVHTRHTHGSKGRYPRHSKKYTIRDGRRHPGGHRLQGGLGIKLGGGGLFGIRMPHQHFLSHATPEEFEVTVYGHPNITNPYRGRCRTDHPTLSQVMHNATMAVHLVILLPRVPRRLVQLGEEEAEDRNGCFSSSVAGLAEKGTTPATRTIPASWKAFAEWLLRTPSSTEIPSTRLSYPSVASLRDGPSTMGGSFDVSHEHPTPHVSNEASDDARDHPRAVAEVGNHTMETRRANNKDDGEGIQKKRKRLRKKYRRNRKQHGMRWYTKRRAVGGGMAGTSSSVAIKGDPEEEEVLGATRSPEEASEHLWMMKKKREQEGDMAMEKHTTPHDLPLLPACCPTSMTSETTRKHRKTTKEKRRRRQESTHSKAEPLNSASSLLSSSFLSSPLEPTTRWRIRKTLEGVHTIHWTTFTHSISVPLWSSTSTTTSSIHDTLQEEKEKASVEEEEQQHHHKEKQGDEALEGKERRSAITEKNDHEMEWEEKERFLAPHLEALSQLYHAHCRGISLGVEPPLHTANMRPRSLPHVPKEEEEALVKYARLQPQPSSCVEEEVAMELGENRRRREELPSPSYPRPPVPEEHPTKQEGFYPVTTTVESQMDSSSCVFSSSSFSLPHSVTKLSSAAGGPQTGRPPPRHDRFLSSTGKAARTPPTGPPRGRYASSPLSTLARMIIPSFSSSSFMFPRPSSTFSSSVFSAPSSLFLRGSRRSLASTRKEDLSTPTSRLDARQMPSLPSTGTSTAAATTTTTTSSSSFRREITEPSSFVASPRKELPTTTSCFSFLRSTKGTLSLLQDLHDQHRLHPSFLCVCQRVHPSVWLNPPQETPEEEEGKEEKTAAEQELTTVAPRWNALSRSSSSFSVRRPRPLLRRYGTSPQEEEEAVNSKWGPWKSLSSPPSLSSSFSSEGSRSSLDADDVTSSRPSHPWRELAPSGGSDPNDASASSSPVPSTSSFCMGRERNLPPPPSQRSSVACAAREVSRLLRWRYANADPRAHGSDALPHAQRAIPMLWFLDASMIWKDALHAAVVTTHPTPTPPKTRLLFKDTTSSSLRASQRKPQDEERGGRTDHDDEGVHHPIHEDPIPGSTGGHQRPSLVSTSSPLPLQDTWVATVPFPKKCEIEEEEGEREEERREKKDPHEEKEPSSLMTAWTAQPPLSTRDVSLRATPVRSPLSPPLSLLPSLLSSFFCEELERMGFQAIPTLSMLHPQRRRTRSLIGVPRGEPRQEWKTWEGLKEKTPPMGEVLFLSDGRAPEPFPLPSNAWVPPPPNSPLATTTEKEGEEKGESIPTAAVEHLDGSDEHHRQKASNVSRLPEEEVFQGLEGKEALLFSSPRTTTTTSFDPSLSLPRCGSITAAAAEEEDEAREREQLQWESSFSALLSQLHNEWGVEAAVSRMPR